MPANKQLVNDEYMFLNIRCDTHLKCLWPEINIPVSVQAQHRGTNGAVGGWAQRADEEGEQPSAQDRTPRQLLTTQGEGPQNLPGRRPCQGPGAGLRRRPPVLLIWIVWLLQQSNQAAGLWAWVSGPIVTWTSSSIVRLTCSHPPLWAPGLVQKPDCAL